MTAQIIRFPVQHSNGYNNLIQFFEVCSLLEACNFYLDTAEILYSEGGITEEELHLLRTAGRQEDAGRGRILGTGAGRERKPAQTSQGI